MELIKKIKEYEWKYHIGDNISYEERKKILGFKKEVRRLFFCMFFYQNGILIRIPSFACFNNKNTGYKHIYTDDLTNAKWYWKSM